MASKVRIPTIVEGQELTKAQKRPRTTCQWLARVRIRLRANLTTAASHYTLIAGRYEVSGEQQQQRVGSFTRSRYRPHQNRRFRHPDPDLDPDPGPPALGPRRVLVLILILVPILLCQIAIGGGAARTPKRAPLVSTKAGMIAEHRTDAVEQEPATNHARCRRCGSAEKRSARTKGRAHAGCQAGPVG